MTLAAFEEFIGQRGWAYREEYVPAGKYEDPATGQVETWDAYTSRTIYRDAPIGDVVVYQVLEVQDDVADRGEQVWQMLVDLGNVEFDRRIDRERDALT